MNKKNYGTIPYYDFLPNQRQICTILILSISSIFFITFRNKTAGHQKNSNLHTESTNNTSSFQYIPAVCGGTTTVSACGNSMVLNADPGQSNYLWSTTETTQSITVNTSGTYWWETIDMANNKVVNGDFSDGNTGFTSGYGSVVSPTSASTSCCTNVIGPEGLYTITTNPNFTHTAYKSKGEHTTATGKKMLVNGSTSAASNSKETIKKILLIDKIKMVQICR
ncbi:MAG: hypothetical protein JWR05_2106 [Mucilaginibacter sp.]|nr:hypothetical protein [Mucilaginibacter sp.]